jgi:hypothetical protein
MGRADAGAFRERGFASCQQRAISRKSRKVTLLIVVDMRSERSSVGEFAILDSLGRVDCLE